METIQLLLGASNLVLLVAILYKMKTRQEI